jgi:Lrp/AsnC family leucine-responsive transcriptional regulator
MIDETDIHILKILQDNARISNAEIARRIGMAQSGTLERVRKLEERGVVAGYEARLEPKCLDLGLLAFVFVRTSERAGEMGAAHAVAELPEVLEVHHVAGDDCLLLKVRTSDTQDLARFLREKLGVLGQVTSTRSTIVMETLKETARLPLPTSNR